MVADALRASGVDIRCDTSATEVVREQGGDGPVRGAVTGGETLVAEEILVATGRARHTARIGLETVGLGPRRLSGP